MRKTKEKDEDQKRRVRVQVSFSWDDEKDICDFVQSINKYGIHAITAGAYRRYMSDSGFYQKQILDLLSDKAIGKTIGKTIETTKAVDNTKTVRKEVAKERIKPESKGKSGAETAERHKKIESARPEDIDDELGPRLSHIFDEYNN